MPSLSKFQLHFSQKKKLSNLYGTREDPEWPPPKKKS